MLFGNVAYDSPATGQGGQPFLLDADNGASLSTLSPATVVLGQDVSEAGNPAALLSDRQIPLSGFNLDLFGTECQFVISDGTLTILNVSNAPLFRQCVLSLLNANASAFMLLSDFVTGNAAHLFQTTLGTMRLELLNDMGVLSDGQGDPSHNQFSFDTTNLLFKIALGGVGFNGALFQVGGPATSGVLVVPENNNVTVSNSDDIGKFFTNEGAAIAIVYNLPVAVSGLRYKFFVENANGVTLQAQGGNRIRFAGVLGAANGSASSITPGSYVELVAINATLWVGCGIVGTWVVL